MKSVVSILLVLFSFLNFFSGHSRSVEKYLSYDACPDNTEKDSALAEVQKGLIQVDSGEYVKAIFHFSKAIEYDPTLASAYLNRALIKYKMMDYKGALNDYAKAQKLKLTWEESYELHYYKGITLVALKDLRNAMNDLNYAIRLRPDLPTPTITEVL
jgi:tetratricopeptide (TPR) repeat protein